jgi:hypothetical protein
MESQKVLIPNSIKLKTFHSIALRLDKLTETLLEENQKLSELKDILLSKLATVEG